MSFQIDKAIGHLLHKASYASFTHLNTILKAYDLTPQLWMLLNRIWDRDGLTQKELADLMYKDQTNLGRLIDKLEALHFIERREHPQDRRAYLIYLTEQGASLKDVLVPQAVEIQKHLLQGMTPEEIELFQGLLRTLIRNAGLPSFDQHDL